MKTIDEILDLATSAADLPSQAIIDALYDHEDEVWAWVIAMQIQAREPLPSSELS